VQQTVKIELNIPLDHISSDETTSSAQIDTDWKTKAIGTLLFSAGAAAAASTAVRARRTPLNRSNYTYELPRLQKLASSAPYSSRRSYNKPTDDRWSRPAAPIDRTSGRKATATHSHGSRGFRVDLKDTYVRTTEMCCGASNSPS